MLLGLDIGKKRIGVAKTDELALMAHSVGLIHRTSDKQAIVEILKLVIEWEVKKVVMGLPKDMKGHIGKAAEGVMAFGTKLQAELQNAELEYWDERLSTRGSERMLIE